MIKYEAPRMKSAGEQAKDMVVYLLTVGAIYLVLYWIFLVVTAPFKFLFMSDGQKLGAKIKRAKEKIACRDALRRKYAEDEGNPMNQYVNRFKLYPEEYREDPENEQYRLWFEGLKNGTLLDTELRWAPDVWRETADGKVITEEFLNYFARQAELHAERGVGIRMAFLKTVRNLYPEFTPRFSVIADEIEEMRERAKAGELYAELTAELEKKGVPKELAGELLKMNLGLEKLREAIVTVKRGLDRGYSQAMCLYCIRKNVDLDDPFIEANGGTIGRVLDELEDEAMATAMIAQEFTEQEFANIVDIADEATDDGNEMREIISGEFRELMKRKCAEEISGR